MPLSSFASNIEDFLTSQIAVEKLTGRGGNNEFSGWVGSLKFDIEKEYIYTSEYSNIDGKVTVVNGIYKITKIEKFEKNINFECVDENPMTAGIGWSGKIWIDDSNNLKFEMVQKQSPRKWVNLGNIGRKFIKGNKLNINLGI